MNENPRALNAESMNYVRGALGSGEDIDYKQACRVLEAHDYWRNLYMGLNARTEALVYQSKRLDDAEDLLTELQVYMRDKFQSRELVVFMDKVNAYFAVDGETDEEAR